MSDRTCPGCGQVHEVWCSGCAPEPPGYQREVEVLANTAADARREVLRIVTEFLGPAWSSIVQRLDEAMAHCETREALARHLGVEP